MNSQGEGILLDKTTKKHEQRADSGSSKFITMKKNPSAKNQLGKNSASQVSLGRSILKSKNKNKIDPSSDSDFNPIHPRNSSRESAPSGEFMLGPHTGLFQRSDSRN